MQKISICAPSHNFATKAHINNRKKNLLNSNTFSICPHNMVNFGPLTAEICWQVWGTPANFNGFRFLSASLHDTLVLDVSQTLWRWTEDTTYIWQGGHHVGHWPTFLVLFIFFFSSPNLSGRRCLPYFYAWCGPNANLECRSEMCCEWLTGNAGPKNRDLGTIAQLCRAISSQLRHVSTIIKNLLNSSVSPKCPHNMVNFGLLAAEICWRVWGTPANLNGFRVLAALLHGTLVVDISQTLLHWTEGATYIWQGGHHIGHWPTFLVFA